MAATKKAKKAANKAEKAAVRSLEGLGRMMKKLFGP